MQVRHSPLALLQRLITWGIATWRWSCTRPPGAVAGQCPGRAPASTAAAGGVSRAPFRPEVGAYEGVPHVPPMADRLRFYQLVSPALPVGAFSYSEGLEVLVQSGQLSSEQAMEDWLRAELLRGGVAMEAAALAPLMALLRAWSAGEPEAVAAAQLGSLVACAARSCGAAGPATPDGTVLGHVVADLGWPLPQVGVPLAGRRPTPGPACPLRWIRRRWRRPTCSGLPTSSMRRSVWFPSVRPRPNACNSSSPPLGPAGAGADGAGPAAAVERSGGGGDGPVASRGALLPYVPQLSQSPCSTSTVLRG